MTLVVSFYPGTTHHTPAADTSTPVLIPLTPIAMVTSAPLRHPHHLHLDSATIPGPSLRQIIARKVTTVGITVRNPPQAGAAPGGAENVVRKAAARRRVTVTISVQNQIPASSWTGSAICSGKGSTKSGATNISTATSATSTRCLLCSISLCPLVFGRTQKETGAARVWTWKVAAIAIAAEAPLTQTIAPLRRALPATVAPQHLSRRSTVALLHLSHPITAVPLPLTCPVMATQRHPS